MVGDENQSIYRFRNADLEVFRARAQRGRPSRRTATCCPCSATSARAPAVLAAVNEVGRTLLDGFAELTAGRTAVDGPGSAELLLTLDEGRARDARKWAQEEIDLEPPPGRLAAEGDRRGALPRAAPARAGRCAARPSAGEIVVLLRAFTHVDAYEEALTRAGLRPFVVGGRGYWTQQQVEDLIRLLGVVANPLDDEYLFGALASFANGVSPDALWLLRRAATREGGPSTTSGRWSRGVTATGASRPTHDRQVARGDRRRGRRSGSSASADPRRPARRGAAADRSRS